jgi:hypothetical protein
MRMVWCTFSLIGYHLFPDAPREVGYLADKHRHEFQFKVMIEVAHDNREIEFHTLKRFCLWAIDEVTQKNIRNEIEFGQMSCEMIADMLMGLLVKDKMTGYFPGSDGSASIGKPRQIIIEVSEDGECGGIITRF